MADLQSSTNESVWLATAPAAPGLHNLSLISIAVLAAIFVGSVLFANVPMVESAGFVPFIQAIMFLTELLTAVLLYTQFAHLRTPSLLILASGYFFTSLIVVAHTLTFPGALAPNGLFGAGLQTTGWLHIVWHFVFPASALAYVMIKGGGRDKPIAASGSLIAGACVCIIPLAVILLTTFLILADASVPRLFLDRSTFAPLAHRTALLDVSVCAIAFIALWRRQSSVLDQWLMIAIFATLLEMMMVTVTTGRFTFGWYAVRMFGVVASTVVLVALLTETTVLYGRLASTNLLLRRERSNRLLSLDAATAALAHEIKQPLTGIATLSATAAEWLRTEPVPLPQLRKCLSAIEQASTQMYETIDGVRSLFAPGAHGKDIVYLGDVVAQVLKLLADDLSRKGIAIARDIGDDMPILADRVQLQQVVINLVNNAIDAMTSSGRGGRRLNVKTRVEDQSTVILAVSDTGGGLTDDMSEKIFEPFFTTKTAGAGLGLAICRAIAQDHGGDLQLASAGPDSSTFELSVPVSEPPI